MREAAKYNNYYKLTCGHIRLISRKLKPVETKKKFYCVKCDSFETAVSRTRDA